MNLAAISHRPTLEYLYPKSREELVFKISCAKNDIKNITLVLWFRQEINENKKKRILMNKILSDGYCDYFESEVSFNEVAAYIRYYFVIDDGNVSFSFGAKGFDDNEPLFNENYFEFLWPNRSDAIKSPDWSNNQIYYQIFPERFNNGNNAITPVDAISWGSKPSRSNFMGGDLIGIINKLDYINDLGATCLYLTPIFKSLSNHKYDTIDYYEIDPSFGTKKDLKNLVDEAHKKGLRILLDGVFNHSGYYWPYFIDLVENGKSSKYADWFFVHDYPVSLDKRNYDCVGNYKWMPKINLENNETAEYFIEVGKYWIKEFNIDGWRLDVADEIPVSFWQKFSSSIKELKPDALLLGETWGDAHKLVNDCRLDSAMNYLFKDAVVLWLGNKKIKVSQFNHLINKMFSLYHKEVVYRLYNPLDSHDTTRFLRECNDDVNYLKLAVAIQMTMPGCPAIFYGDEIGLTGDNDPDCRLCMEWDKSKQNIELLSWYKKLISIRKSSSVFTDGSFNVLIIDDTNNVYAYQRDNKKDSVIVVINGGNKAYDVSSIINDKEYEELLSDRYIAEKAGSLCASVPAYSAYIYKKKGVLK